MNIWDLSFRTLRELRRKKGSSMYADAFHGKDL